MAKKENVRAGIYLALESLKDFDNEVKKHSKTLSESTGAKVSLSRGDFISLLTKKLKSGEIKL